jgi:putative transposase
MARFYWKQFQLWYNISMKRQRPNTWIKKNNPYLQAVHSQVLQEVATRLDQAYDHFFWRVKSGKEKPGFPTFKGRQHYDSLAIPSPDFSLLSNKLELSEIGTLKIKIHRPLGGTDLLHHP